MSSTTETIAWINNMILQLNRYLPYPFLILGTAGVVLNMVIFTRRSLFINSCTQYLIGNTIANFVVLYWVVFTRIFSDGYKIDPSTASDTFCSVRYFFTYVSRTLSTWFILLACIDRWLSSLKAQRRFNSVLFARIVIIIATVVALASFANVLVYFGIQRSATSVTCYAISGPYRLFSDLQYLVFYAVGPPLLMLVFGLLTLRNLRRAHRQVTASISQVPPKSNARRDGQLLAMLLMQVAMIIVFTLPFAAQKLYDTFTLGVKKTPLKAAEDNLLGAVVRILSYGSHAFGFFVYTLSARIFRVELYRVVNTVYRLITGRQLIISNFTQTRGLTMGTMEMRTHR